MSPRLQTSSSGARGEPVEPHEHSISFDLLHPELDEGSGRAQRGVSAFSHEHVEGLRLRQGFDVQAGRPVRHSLKSDGGAQHVVLSKRSIGMSKMRQKYIYS